MKEEFNFPVFMRACSRVFRALRKKQKFETLAAMPFPGYVWTLSQIENSPARFLYSSELCEIWAYSTAGATGTGNQLERFGWITRAHDSEDRRKVMLMLTAEGRLLLAEVENQMEQMEAAA